MTFAPGSAPPVEMFISYCHDDDKLRAELETHLTPLTKLGLMSVWNDRRIRPGNSWQPEIDGHINVARVILLLVSPSFLKSTSCQKEIECAMRRSARGEAVVVPIILRPVEWDDQDFAHLQALPEEGKPVTMWRSHDAAFADVAKNIKRIVSELHPKCGNEECSESGSSDGESRKTAVFSLDETLCESECARRETAEGTDESGDEPRGLEDVDEAVSGTDDAPSPHDGATITTKVETDMVDLEVTIAANYDSFSEADKKRVLDGIARFLEIDANITVVRKRRGSVKLLLRLPSHQAERLHWAIQRGDLGAIGVSDSELMDRAQERTSDNYHVKRGSPSTAELEVARPRREIDSETLDDAHPQPPNPGYFRWKGVLDRILAALLLIPGLPIIGLLVVLVRRNSAGPGIFRQTRAGRNGVTFVMYKIRTMRVDAEAATGPVWTQPGDQRITRLGWFLRKMHLDELPQLFNVLRGEMSLVGPRPERPEFVAALAAHIPSYYSRLTVLPGVTGLAQINLPPEKDLDSVRCTHTLDLEYIRTAGLWLDARMLLCSCLRLIGCSGQLAMRMMRLERNVSLASDEPRDDAATEDATAGPADRGTTVVGSGDTQTFDPGDLAEALRARELQAAASNGPRDAESPGTNLLQPPTPERRRQQAMASRSAYRSPLAPRDGTPSRRSVMPTLDPLAPQRSGRASTSDPCDLSGVFTVDVEDYFHVTAFENDIPRDRWGEYPSRVVDNTRRVLDLLARHHVYGTFFVLGWVAERFPRLVEEIDAAGHQIGSHGYWHRRIYQQTRDEFREDLQKSRDVLMDIIGRSVTAYRAPCFSITQESVWALDILAEEGFVVDSSIFPIHHDRYGMPGAKQTVYRIATGAGLLWEFPPATLRLAGVNVPVSGGGYFRLMPVRLTIQGLKAARRRSGLPFVFYIHPWELDPDQPRLGVGSLTSRARHYLNLSSTEGKLDVLLSRFRFGRVEDVVAQLQPPEVC